MLCRRVVRRRSQLVAGTSALLAAACGCPAPPGTFDISGITGPVDTAPDAWLSGGGPTLVNWTPSAGAESYEAVIYDVDGSTVRCAAVTRQKDARQADFAGCALVDGNRYRAAVTAIAGAARTAAANSPFAFTAEYWVYGQPDAATNNNLLFGLACPSDALVVGGRLYVADQCNNRVLIWTSLPTQNQQPPNLVLGQTDLTTSAGGASARSLGGVTSLASDGVRLIAGDRFNNRVLVWNSLPTASNQPADLVLGQPDMTTATRNTGGVSARSMTEPTVMVAAGRLLVADRYNHRVLIWNAMPTQSHAPADLVLGQPDMVSSSCNSSGNIGANTLCDPFRGAFDGTRLWLPDLSNHRVLVWSSLPGVNSAPATLVLGQPNMTSGLPNAGQSTPSASGFSAPIAVFAQNGFVAVSEYTNQRVLVWTASVATNQQPANFVLGQADMATVAPNAGGVSASSLNTPEGSYADSGQLLLADRFNNRILFYRPLPSVNAAPASLVLGQPDFTSSRRNNPGKLDATTVGASGVTRAGAGIAVSDTANQRVLLWKSTPRSSRDAPDWVLGQADLTSVAAATAPSATNFCSATAVQSDGTRLFVGDVCHQRVLVWNILPTANRQPADLVLGQPDMGTRGPNSGGLSARSLSFRPAPFSDGRRLYVADFANNRVLVWNAMPAANGQAADLVLGQPDMVSNAVNNGGLGAKSLNGPQSVASDGTRVAVTDTRNHRVLLWNAPPTASFQPADVVLGQPNMTSNATPSAPSPRNMRFPVAAHFDRGRLYVVDRDHHRILWWKAVPATNETPADGVIGQPNPNAGVPNNGGLSGRTLFNPAGVMGADDQLFIADMGNNRLVARPVP